MDILCLKSYLVYLLTVVIKHKPVAFVNVSSVNATIMKGEIQLSFSMKELIDVQSNDTFCCTLLKLINDNKVSLDKYFISGNGLLHKVVRR